MLRRIGMPTSRVGRSIVMGLTDVAIAVMIIVLLCGISGRDKRHGLNATSIFIFSVACIIDILRGDVVGRMVTLVVDVDVVVGVVGVVVVVHNVMC